MSDCPDSDFWGNHVVEQPGYQLLNTNLVSYLVISPSRINCLAATIKRLETLIWLILPVSTATRQTRTACQNRAMHTKSCLHWPWFCGQFHAHELKFKALSEVAPLCCYRATMVSTYDIQYGVVDNLMDYNSEKLSSNPCLKLSELQNWLR